MFVPFITKSDTPGVFGFGFSFYSSNYEKENSLAIALPQSFSPVTNLCGVFLFLFFCALVRPLVFMLHPSFRNTGTTGTETPSSLTSYAALPQFGSAAATAAFTPTPLPTPTLTQAVTAAAGKQIEGTYAYRWHSVLPQVVLPVRF